MKPDSFFWTPALLSELLVLGRARNRGVAEESLWLIPDRLWTPIGVESLPFGVLRSDTDVEASTVAAIERSQSGILLGQKALRVPDRLLSDVVLCFGDTILSRADLTDERRLLSFYVRTGPHWPKGRQLDFTAFDRNPLLLWNNSLENAPIGRVVAHARVVNRFRFKVETAAAYTLGDDVDADMAVSESGEVLAVSLVPREG